MIARITWGVAGLAVLAAWWTQAGPRWALAAAVGTLLVTAPAAFDLGARAARRALRRSAAKRGLELPDDPSVERLVLTRDRYLLTGAMRVTDVETLRAGHERNLRWFAGALEHHAEHRVGRAIARLSTRGRVTDVVEEPDLGIRGVVDRHPVRVGRPEWIGVAAPADPLATTVAVEVDDRPLGMIRLVDEIAPSAASGVAQLREHGIACTLATRLTAVRAKDLAAQVGIDDVRAPADPAEVAAQLREQGMRASTLAAPEGDADLRRVAEAYALARGLPARVRRARRLTLAFAVIAGLGAAAAPGLAALQL